jgi:peptide-methionine (S)-S-oxide reductase
VYDPSRVGYRQLLEVFFTVAHDPTSRDRQGPDAGPEYRAAVLYQSSAERETASAFMAELKRSGRFTQPIVTELRQLSAFSVAEAFHQDYGARHPDDPYIVRNDAPKLVHLQESFPALYQDRRSP